MIFTKRRFRRGREDAYEAATRCEESARLQNIIVENKSIQIWELVKASTCPNNHTQPHSPPSNLPLSMPHGIFVCHSQAIILHFEQSNLKKSRIRQAIVHLSPPMNQECRDIEGACAHQQDLKNMPVSSLSLKIFGKSCPLTPEKTIVFHQS